MHQRMTKSGAVLTPRGMLSTAEAVAHDLRLLESPRLGASRRLLRLRLPLAKAQQFQQELQQCQTAPVACGRWLQAGSCQFQMVVIPRPMTMVLSPVKMMARQVG